MSDVLDTVSTAVSERVPERLNQSCFCVTLDREELGLALDREAGEPGFYDSLIGQRPHLFSNIPVFLSASALAEMQDIVEAIETAARLPAYRDTVLSWAPDIAKRDFGPAGVLMGYDFHLGDDGPKLIEVNTNAGGAFLNAVLARAQEACCADVKIPAARLTEDFEERAVAMFLEEWRRQRGAGKPATVAIIDDAPGEQYLYPEFVLARQMLERHGIHAVIGDARDLQYRDGGLYLGSDRIDLVYNRLVDFALEGEEHAALRRAYQEDAVVLTPNPHHHALLANKRNLTLLSDLEALRTFGLPETMWKRLAGIPQTRLVTPENAERFWEARKGLFFKPLAGHGGKAVYRGDKVTKSVWGEIARGGYVAQTFAAPSQRKVSLDGEHASHKLDIRLYTYRAEPLLVAARLYQGQTTNFRTPGGGFAPVLVV